jgi:hypothetical protein
MHVDPRVGSILEAFENISLAYPAMLPNLNACFDRADSIFTIRRVEYPI